MIQRLLIKPRRLNLTLDSMKKIHSN
jgi:hypothetical protein